MASEISQRGVARFGGQLGMYCRKYLFVSAICSYVCHSCTSCHNCHKSKVTMTSFYSCMNGKIKKEPKNLELDTNVAKWAAPFYSTDFIWQTANSTVSMKSSAPLKSSDMLALYK